MVMFIWSPEALLVDGEFSTDANSARINLMWLQHKNYNLHDFSTTWKDLKKKIHSMFLFPVCYILKFHSFLLLVEGVFFVSHYKTCLPQVCFVLVLLKKKILFEV